MMTVRRELAGGTLLIAGSAAGCVVMALHPTVAGLMSPDSGPHLTRVNAFVHGLGLAATPMVFLGLLALWRRLGSSDLATAALVLYGWGCVAVMSAAVASGFVSPGVIASIDAPSGSNLPEALLHYTGLWNQGFAKVHVVATSIGILLFSAVLLSGARMAKALGAFGLVVGTMIPLLFFAGHLRLDVHGFGIVIVSQSAWQVGTGIWMCREPRGAVLKRPESV